MSEKRNHFSIIIFSMLPFMYAVLQAQTNPNSVLFSQRVGERIDQYERLYFGLFPKITLFDSAQVTQQNDSSFAVKIYRTSVKDTLIDLNKNEFSFLRNYIDAYETVSAYEEDKLLSQRDETFIRLVQRKIIQPQRISYNDESPSFMFTRMDGMRFNSKILYAVIVL